MFTNITKINTLQDYFVPLSNRGGNKTYFMRMSGYSDESLEFLSKLYHEAGACGTYINKTIQNPTDSEVRAFNEYTGGKTKYSRSEIEGWLDKIPQEKANIIISAIQYQLSTIKSLGLGDSIVKNGYTKLMCWAKFRFHKLMGYTNKTPKVIYEGNIGKYELYLMNFLSLVGCDVMLVNFFGDEEYLKVDPNGVYSGIIAYNKKGEPAMHFKAMSIKYSAAGNTGVKGEITPNNNSPISQSNLNTHQSATMIDPKKREQQKQLMDKIQTNQCIGKDIFESTLIPMSQRTGTVKYKNIFAMIEGVEGDDYSNKLFFWMDSAKSKNKIITIFNKQIPNPEPNEVARFKNPIISDIQEWFAKVSQYIDFLATPDLNEMAKYSLERIMVGQDQGKARTRVMTLICWLYRYKDVIKFNEDTYTFIMFGQCKYNEGFFLELLASISMDVLLVCTNQNVHVEYKSPNMLIKTFDIFENIEEFPTKEKHIQLSTTAHQAQRELDTILYSDDGFYRNRQFVNSVPITLKTTYDEINILWKTEAKFRPHFSTRTEYVTVPNIFAKVSGIEDGNIGKYWAGIKEKVTKDTIVHKSVNFANVDRQGQLFYDYNQFIKNGRLDQVKIKSSHYYKYDYLNGDIQDYILDKIDEVLTTDWLGTNKNEIQQISMMLFLNLDKELIRIIQRFDFTKEIPKLIIIHTDEATCRIEDCVYITFLSLVGFDVVIYTPTGYRDIEKYFVKEIYTEHKIGEYIFDLYPPSNIYTGGGGSITGANSPQNVFNKFFGKGR